MTEIEGVALPVLKYLSGESTDICRLCFGNSDSGVYLDESRLLKSSYYDDTVTFEDMLTDLGAIDDPSLPQMLCQYCADLAMNSFLFKKLCKLSYNRWNDTLDKLDNTLDLSDSLGPKVETAYLVMDNESHRILTSRKHYKNKNKAVVLGKFRELLKGRQTYEKVKNKFAVVCEECGEKFHSRSHLTKHMKKKHNKNYPCKKCPKVFLTEIHLEDHLERIHRPKTIECPKCPKMFSSEKTLKVHDASNHIACICKLCFVQFPSKKDLRQHLNRHDRNTCPRCNKEFQHKHSFNVHIKMCGAVNKELFYCDICNKRYNHKNGLRAHLIAIHGYGKVYTCKWCKKPFDVMSKLKYHIVKHTGERNFYCDQCGKQFVTIAALIYHVRLHTGERPFPCDMCDESFLSASRRMEHKRRKHWGPKRECPYCHNKFVTNHELQKHVARHKNPKSQLFIPDHEDIKIMNITE